MKITTKRYVVSTSALNCYGYRVLTDGVDLTQFLKNPVLFWMHKKDDTPSPYDKKIPLGRAVDVKKEGDEITCRLGFSESNPFAMIIYGMYEDETLNMLSLGAIPLEWSAETELMVAGQTGLTFTTSKATEFSCCDIGANDEAIACMLYDADDNPIELSNLTTDALIKLFNPLQPIEQNYIMKLIQLTGPALNGILLALKLEETATEVQVQKAVADMIQLNATQATNILTLSQAKTDLEAKVIKLEGEQTDAKVIKLADDNKKKYLPAQRDTYIRLAKVDFDGTKSLLEGMPDLTTVKEKLELAKGQSTELDGLIQLSWDTLFETGKLERLKELDGDAFLAKRQEKYPVAPSKK